MKQTHNDNNKWDSIYKTEGVNYKYYDIFQPHESMPRIAEFFKEHNVKKVLDLGCGAGRNLLFLLKSGFDVYGMDLSEEGLRLAGQKLLENNLTADLKRINFSDKFPYPNKFFDAVISVQVLQHGVEKDILKSIGEIERVLKPKGMVFMTLSGRYSEGRIRKVLVKTARMIAPNTYVPTEEMNQGCRISSTTNP